MKILFVLYDILFIVLLFLYLPVYFLRGKMTRFSFLQRLGIFSAVKEDSCVWIQVVSVGEVQLIHGLLKKISEVSKSPIVISTTTLTGYNLACKKYASFAKIIFFPFDISFIVRRVINLIKPRVFIAVETEVWPQVFYQLKKKGVPIFIVNGRISDKAFNRYKKITFLMRHLLNYCKSIVVQNDFYKARFLYLGAHKEKIRIGGNMKFESMLFDNHDLLNFREKYFKYFKTGDKLFFIAASTHPLEEEMVLKSMKNLRLREGVSFSTMIAPRHVERVAAIEKLVESFGYTPVRVSQIEKVDLKGNEIFILDSIGQLSYLYLIADLCFVGGSLVKIGGHNILEPLYFCVPTLFGPYMENFQDIRDIVIEKGAGIQLQDAENLTQMLERLVNDPALRNNLRKKCKNVFEEEKVGLARNLEVIMEYL